MESKDVGEEDSIYSRIENSSNPRLGDIKSLLEVLRLEYSVQVEWGGLSEMFLKAGIQMSGFCKDALDEWDSDRSQALYLLLQEGSFAASMGLKTRLSSCVKAAIRLVSEPLIPGGEGYLYAKIVGDSARAVANAKDTGPESLGMLELYRILYF